MYRNLLDPNSENLLISGDRAADALTQRFRSSRRISARADAGLFDDLAPDEAFDRLPDLIAAAGPLLAMLADYTDVSDAVARLKEAPANEVVATRKPDRRNLSSHDRAAIDLLAAISIRVEALSILQRAVVLLTAGRTAGGKINDSTATNLVGSDVRRWRRSRGDDLGGGFLDCIQGIDTGKLSSLRQRLEGIGN